MSDFKHEHWICRRCESVDGPLTSDKRCCICVTDDGDDGDVVGLVYADAHRGAVDAIREVRKAALVGLTAYDQTARLYKGALGRVVEITDAALTGQ